MLSSVEGLHVCNARPGLRRGWKARNSYRHAMCQIRNRLLLRNVPTRTVFHSSDRKSRKAECPRSVCGNIASNLDLIWCVQVTSATESLFVTFRHRIYITRRLLSSIESSFRKCSPVPVFPPTGRSEIQIMTNRSRNCAKSKRPAKLFPD